MANAQIPPPPTQQKLQAMEITQLKSLSDVHIGFEDHPLTAIMGTNCSGKTTVLHALACAYQPISDDGGYKFPQFFKPNIDSLWKGSKFSVSWSQRVGAKIESRTTVFEKASDRWTPRYEKRPSREVRLLMIRDSVPEVEVFGLNGMVHYARTARTNSVDVRVREAAGQVLNKSYSQYHSVTYQRGKRISIGVSAAGLTYPALSMSSGEQRIFHVIQMVFEAPKHSLLLIDEIDLFLHQDALEKLLRCLNEHCASQQKQLVFTTHFPPVAKMYRDISVQTLHSASGKTIVLSGYSHAALRGITGINEKPISIFVEDDVATAIVRRVATELHILPFVEVGGFGSAENAFALAAGLQLSGRPLENILVVMDGDKSSEKPERLNKIKDILTGTEEGRKAAQKRAASLVRRLAPVKAMEGKLLSPEQMLHRMLHSITDAVLDAEDAQLLGLARAVVNMPDRHGLINTIIESSGDERPVTLANLVKLASKAADWPRFTRLLRFWLTGRKAALNL
jgi:ABC-type lipoprotein export system ATPase subunit